MVPWSSAAGSIYPPVKGGEEIADNHERGVPDDEPSFRVLSSHPKKRGEGRRRADSDSQPE